jgi:quercetin dioxygenase-like cupin family protein
MSKRVAGCCLLGLGLMCGQLAMAEPAVPVEQEPAHRLVLQNPYVRVFDVWLPPGQQTLWHIHRRDGVSVRVTDASIADDNANGQTVPVTVRRGAVNFGATPVEMTHRVRNVGATTFHNVYVELHAAGAAEASGVDATATVRPVELENDRVRVLRRTLAVGESTGVHTHAVKGLGVTVSAGRLEVTDRAGATRVVDVKAGAAQWIDAGTVHALKNIGADPIEMVDVELK